MLDGAAGKNQAGGENSDGKVRAKRISKGAQVTFEHGGVGIHDADDVSGAFSEGAIAGAGRSQVFRQPDQVYPGGIGIAEDDLYRIVGRAVVDDVNFIFQVLALAYMGDAVQAVFYGFFRIPGKDDKRDFFHICH